MYICLCTGTTEADWRAALVACGGEHQRAVMQTGVGLGCGSCRSGLVQLAAHASFEDCHPTPPRVR